MRYFDVEQGSEEWFNLRKGVPTASNFDKILTPKNGALSAQAEEYINELVGETLSLIPPDGAENYTTRAMQWGQRAEAEARAFYCMHHDCDVLNGGFCMTNDGRFGASPDFLVGIETGGEYERDAQGRPFVIASARAAGELKCPQGKTQVRYLRSAALPSEYRWQVHGHLIVTGAEYCDFLSYSPGLAPLCLRVEAGEDTLTLRRALEEFHVKYQAALKSVIELRA